ncbi:MAG TPA: hypothetical protein VHX42_04060 [Candidatus Babeliales bacterium]|jgi:hypothetical protein|nr:hypothetical protein [Candidatus Babeliales bacterium]
MKYFLNILFLMSFAGSVVGSEKRNEIIVFKANVGTLNANPLRYCDKKYIDFLNDQYGMQCKYNEPFLRVFHPTIPQETQEFHLKKEFIEQITFVPYKCFMYNDKDPRESDRFKQSGTVLLSFFKEVQNENRQIQIQLTSDFETMKPKILLQQFKEMPQCNPGNIFNENGDLLVFVDTTDLEKELCEADIVQKVGRDYGYGHGKQKYEQWVNGYFGEEIKAKQRAALFYSRLKKLCGFSIAAIIAYLVYQKFYATAG